MIRNLVIVLFLFAASCSEHSYKRETLIQDFRSLLHKDYGIDDVNAVLKENTFWIHMSVEKILEEIGEFHDASLEKVRRVGGVIHRVLFSSDSGVEFVYLIASDKNGLELRMLRHIEDLKKVRFWYISYNDFYTRSDIGLEINPEHFGKESVKDLVKKIQKGDIESAGKNIKPSRRESILEKIPLFLEGPSEIKTLRVGLNKALVYMELNQGVYGNKHLFLIDVEFMDLLKNLLMLYMIKKDDVTEVPEKKQSDKKEKSNADPKVSFPVIFDYWDLSQDDWPYEYAEDRDVSKWSAKFYSKKIEFEDFIAEQFERKIKKLFKENKNDWKLKIKSLYVENTDGLIDIERKITKLENPLYNIDPDHEIAMLVARTVKSYEIDDFNKLVIHSPLWKERSVYTREGLAKIKRKKYKKLKRKPKEADDSPSLKNILLSLFVPAFTANTQENDTGKEKKYKKTASKYRDRLKIEQNRRQKKKKQLKALRSGLTQKN